MEDVYKKNFWFQIEQKSLISILKREGGGYKLADEALKAQTYFISEAEKLSDKRVRSYFAETVSKNSIGNNISNSKLSTINLRIIFFLFFQPNYNYSVKDIIAFFNALTAEKDAEIKQSFDLFFENIKQVLSDDSPLKKINYDFDYNKGKFYVNQDSAGFTPPPAVEKNPIKWQLILSIVFGLAVLFFFGYGFFIHNKQQDIERKEVEKRQIIENAKNTKASRTPQLVSIYDAINLELKNDYNKDNMRNLSTELIGRIVALSEEMTPYLYVKNNKIIKSKLSPERASLFLNIVNSKLDAITFSLVIGQSDFSYSDLSGVDLSGLDLLQNFYGVNGYYKKELRLLISSIERGNFRYSDFKNSNLSSAILFGDFSYSDFSNVVLKDTNFEWSNLYRSNFEGSKITDTSFRYSTMNHSNFENVTMRGTFSGFDYCDLRGVLFDNSSFFGGMLGQFHFNTCFFSSEGTFFSYNFDTIASSIRIIGKPFMDQAAYTDIDSNFSIYEILKTSNENGFSYKLHPKFSFFGSEYSKSKFIKQLRTRTFDERIHFYLVVTNDNFNRGEYALYDYFRKHILEKNKNKIALDSTYLKKIFPVYKSDFNSLEIDKDDSTFKYPQKKDSLMDGIASFRNCKFTNVIFKNCSLEYVSFENSEFEDKSRFFGNNFNNVRLRGNDFRIKSGDFQFDNNTQYDSLIANDKFPIEYLRK